MIRKCGNEFSKIANIDNEQPLCNGSNGYLKTSLNAINNKCCCVCLNSFLALNSLSKNENGCSLLNKLQINIPQVVSINLLNYRHIYVTNFTGLAIRLFYL